MATIYRSEHFDYYTVGVKKEIRGRKVGTLAYLPTDADEETIDRAEDSCLNDLNIWLNPPIPA